MRAQPSFYAELRSCISHDRLEAYRRTPTDGVSVLIARYLWNMALSEALYSPIQGLEIALRNSMHDAISHHVAADDWFDPRHHLLQKRELGKVAIAKSELARHGKPLDSGRIIAELTFGFWISLLDSPYDVPLWRHLLTTTFPHLPRRLLKRRILLHKLEPIRQLRNRAFHHEPLWYRSDLSRRHMDMYDVMNWISPTLGATVKLVDRFPVVYQAGYKPLQQKLEAFASSTLPSPNP